MLYTSLLEPEIFSGFQKGARFGLWIRPQRPQQARGLILAIQTPGEENNLSRRVMVRAANLFATHGFTTLLFDPFGVGDSDGETAQARIQDWRADLLRISHVLRQRHDLPFFVWGVRLGSLFAADLLISQSDTINGVMMWAPLAHGRTWVDHLNRGQALSRMMRGATLPGRAVGPLGGDSVLIFPSSQIDGLDMPAGPIVHLGGTAYQQALVEEIRALSLNPVRTQDDYGTPPQVAMFAIVPPQSRNIRRSTDNDLPPALQTMASHWRNSGFPVHAQAVASEPFWSSQMPTESLELYEASLAWLDRSVPTP